MAVLLLAWALRGGSPARRRALIAGLLFGATDFISGVILKDLLPRDRPTGGDDSFPSSHAANAFGQAVYFSILFPRLSPLLLLLASAIGLSRVALGKHWPTDVLAGALLGAALGIAAWRASLRWQAGRQPHPRPESVSLPGIGPRE